MLDLLFGGLFTASTISLTSFLLCMAAALLIGVLLMLVYARRSRSSASFLATLALLPAVVCVVIMTVNGNVGAGVAVAGAFSLVRFRSVPGTAREIGVLFLAMAAGLICGMGYIGYGFLFTAVMCAAMAVLELAGASLARKTPAEKLLHIVIPEDLDYYTLFDDLFAQYTSDWEVLRVKTTNMGSLFKLTARVVLKDAAQEKAFIDALRCRNGNLEISLSRMEANNNEL